jgi:hypothetical protein
MLLGRLGLGQVGRREFHCRFRLNPTLAHRLSTPSPLIEKQKCWARHRRVR